LGNHFSRQLIRSENCMGENLLGLRTCSVAFIQPPLDEWTIISLQINTSIEYIRISYTVVLQINEKGKA
jgi:hypothetical protein